jgi:RHS repeat-associated protein
VNHHSRARGLTAILTAALVVAGFLPATTSVAAVKPHLPKPHKTKLVPHRVLEPRKHAAAAVRVPSHLRGDRTWPAAQSSTFGHTEAKPAKQPAGIVSVTPTRTSDQTLGSERVHVLSHTAAEDAHVDGVLFTVTRLGTSTTPLSLALKYASFADAAGGNFGERLQLVSLPQCALTTPQRPACQRQTPLLSHNDARHQTLTATVASADPTSIKPASKLSEAVLSSATNSSVVLAAASAASSPGGTFTATSLAPSGTWGVTGNTGNFTWSYPISTPPAAAGSDVAPSVGLDYNSGTTDGRISTTNDQSSWAGEGWDYSPGYIERTYIPCSELTSLPTARKTNDLCWDGQVVTMNLGGNSTPVVLDDSSGQWKLQHDDGSRVQLVGAAANGKYQGEYWVVTAPSGVQYYFGKDTLPGGTGSQNTNATWTEPVFGDTSSDPCYNATVASSYCTQAWRWNLDYVVDPNNNATAYYYNTPETNYYALDAKTTTPVEYDRGGTLKEIDYGLRLENGSVYGTSAPDKVLFTTAQRCVPSGTVTCTAAQFTTANQANWPDSPADLVCKSTGTCNNASPSYWSNMKLTTIASQVDLSGTYKTIDSYALNQSFPTSGDAELRLDSIVHTGYATTGSTSIALPAVSFTYGLLANHVSGVNGQPDLDEWRMSGIETETGEKIAVYYDQSGYSPALCTSSTLPSAPSTNTTECFPVIWTPLGDSKPVTDYFHKYVVTEVLQQDLNGTSPPRETTYHYVGSPAWHYDDNEVVKPSERTWGQFRGYGKVTTETGDTANVSNGAHDQVTETNTLYFRGMDGDTLPAGATRSASVTDTTGDAYTDLDQYDGYVLETQTMNSATGAEVSAAMTVPETVATTATRARNGLPSIVATMVRTLSSTTYTDLAVGGTMFSRSDYQYDKATGQQTYDSSTGTGVITKCVSTSYAVPPAPLLSSSWIRDRVDEVITASEACPTDGSTLASVISDVRTYYDQTAGNSTPLGQVPGAGNPTETDTAQDPSGSSYTWDVATATYDTSGRVSSHTTDVAGGANRTASTTYTPADGGPLTQVKTTNPAGQATTTKLDPGRGSTTGVTDIAGHTTSAAYDALGRLTSVWYPGQVMGTNSATDTYSYTLGQSAPLAVTTKTLVDPGNGTSPAYHTTVSIYDALGTLRQTQTQAPTSGIVVTDSYADSHGWVIGTTSGWPTTGAPSAKILTTSQSAINDSTQTAYDTVGRPTSDTDYQGTAIYSTDKTVYDGDSSTVIPPSGGVEATTTINAAGNAMSLQEWKTPPSISPSGLLSGGAADTTTYTYDALGRQLTMTNAAGTSLAATWTTTYNLAGETESQVDPDTGTTSSQYDTAGDLVLTTTPTSTLAYTYDLLGRKTGEYQNSKTGTQLAGWAYDTVQAGQLSSETTYAPDGSEYTVKDTAYDGQGNLLNTEVDLPPSLTGQGFAASYKTSYTYTTTGLESTETPAPGGSLPAEPLDFTYDALGDPIALQGVVNYVTNASYDAYGDPTQYALGVNNQAATLTYTYDPHTLLLSAENLSSLQAVPQIDNVAYTYDLSNNLTKSVDTQGGGTGAPVETECYGYDSLDRLSEAWTATDACASNPAVNGASTVGGPEPYWTQWTLNDANERTQQVQNAVTGGLTDTVTTGYTDGGSQIPAHGLATTTSTNSEGTSLGTNTYQYNPDGSTKTRYLNGTEEDFSYTPQGLTSSVTTAGQVASYIYTADGDELTATDAGTVTLYLPDEELTLTAGTITGTRYYSVDGTVVAERVGHTNDDYLFANSQHTAEIAVPTTQTGTAAPIRRELDPYGNEIGSTSGGAWPDNHTFLNKPSDPVSNLSQLGARQYDPTTGRFLSVDPILEPQPLDDNGYSYAGNNPVTASDPTGLYVENPSGGESDGSENDSSVMWYGVTHDWYSSFDPDLTGTYKSKPAYGSNTVLTTTCVGESCTSTSSTPKGIGPFAGFLSAAKTVGGDFTGCAGGSGSSCAWAATDVFTAVDALDPLGDGAAATVYAGRAADIAAKASEAGDGLDAAEAGEAVGAGDGSGSGASRTYHRPESTTQTAEDAQKQVNSREVWGQEPQFSHIPKVQAYDGPLPEGARGIEFTTDVEPDPYGIPGQPTWSGPRPGVRVEGDFAKICVTSIWTNQC